MEFLVVMALFVVERAVIDHLWHTRAFLREKRVVELDLQRQRAPGAVLDGPAWLISEAEVEHAALPLLRESFIAGSDSLALLFGDPPDSDRWSETPSVREEVRVESVNAGVPVFLDRVTCATEVPS